jgi:AraC-like DNA-binding protein
MKSIEPCIWLRQYIESYFIWDDRDAVNRPSYFATSKSFIKISDDSAVFTGPSTKPVSVSETESRCGLAVSFRPGVMRYIIGKPASLFTDLVLNLENLTDRSDLGALSDIRTMPDIAKKISLLENLLIGLVKAYAEKASLRESSLDILIDTPSFTISGTADELGITPRHLQRIAQDHLGMNLSLFKRITRFGNAVERITSAKQDISWSSIAYDCGYSDQSHFNREFKEFSGYTPSEYLSLISMSDLFNTTAE